MEMFTASLPPSVGITALAVFLLAFVTFIAAVCRNHRMISRSVVALGDRQQSLAGEISAILAELSDLRLAQKAAERRVDRVLSTIEAAQEVSQTENLLISIPATVARCETLERRLDRLQRTIEVTREEARTLRVRLHEATAERKGDEGWDEG